MGPPTLTVARAEGSRICWSPGKAWGAPPHFPLIPPGLDSPRVKQVLLAQAEAEKIRKIGEAEAAVIEAMGKAEAERMKLKAEAYQKYGDAAKMALVLEALPQVRLPPQAGAGWASAGLPWAFSNTATGRLEGLDEGVLSTGEGTLQQASAPPGPLDRLTVTCKWKGWVRGRRHGGVLDREGGWMEAQPQPALLPPYLLDRCQNLRPTDQSR